VSVAPPPSAPGATAAAGFPHGGQAAEACPLCGGPLAPDQEWCLRCGAAARTRLAATPNWRAPVLAIAAVLALSLGVLAAALVKLAADTGTPAPITQTVTSTAAAPGALAPGAGAALPGAATTQAIPSAPAATPGATPPLGTQSAGRAALTRATTAPGALAAPGATGAPASGTR
jgi:hypothetical protein